MKYIRWFWQQSRGLRWNTVVRIVAGILQVALGLGMVWLSKRFIDETIRTGSEADVWRMIVMLAGTVMGGVLLRQMYYYMTNTANIRLTNTIRLSTFGQLFTLQLYDDQELHSGDVTSRLSKDIETVSAIITSTFPQMVITGIQLLGAFLMMRYFDRRLAWALLLLTPIAVVFGKMISRRLRQMTHDIRQDESRIQMHIQEGMEHNAVLRSLQSEQWVAERLSSIQQQLKGNVVRRTRFTVVVRILLGSAFGLGYLLAFVWGGLQLRNGAITFGVMTSFLQLVGMIQHPILQLLNMVPELIHASASIDRIEELCPPDRHRPEASAIRQEPIGIRFRDVSFHYASEERAVVSHFTHDFSPGSKTAIMGETGIGKTTLFRLLLGFIEPAEGTIEIYSWAAGETAAEHAGETAAYHEAAGEATRQNFVFVPQGNTLMSGTIRYNLQLAKPDATDEELLQVLHTAAADFVTSLPEGLDTELGERGGGLSEGQAQRIAIARGLLRPGNILLLDEISSALDERTEHELFSRLAAAYPQKTMLFITHRSTCTDLCDEVIRLK